MTYKYINFHKAERGGFEPPDPRKQINGFRDRPVRPLRHLSEGKISDIHQPCIISIQKNVKIFISCSVFFPGAKVEIKK
jgi:Cys-tRNA synthase (O-phospho-L-seryl-tRNA:Cys-tRNA synthase)